MGGFDDGYEFGSVPDEVVLANDERVLWTGQPTTDTFVLTGRDAFVVPFSMVWGGFVLVWNVAVWTLGAPLLFRLWGLPFLVVGLYITVGRFLHNAYERRNTLYLLTTHRAIIVRRGTKRSTRDRNLAMLSGVETDIRPDGTGTIVFEPEVSRRRGKQQSLAANGLDGFQFFRIDNARAVIEQLRTNTTMPSVGAKNSEPSSIDDTPGWQRSPRPVSDDVPFPPGDGRPAPSPWE